MIEAELKGASRSLLDLLPQRERLVMEQHYLNGRKLKDIASDLGVSCPRVSQIHAAALARLRAALDGF